MGRGEYATMGAKTRDKMLDFEVVRQNNLSGLSLSLFICDQDGPRWQENSFHKHCITALFDNICRGFFSGINIQSFAVDRTLLLEWPP